MTAMKPRLHFALWEMNSAGSNHSFVPDKSWYLTHLLVFLFTWCVRPARVHTGEVDVFVLRGPSLRQNHLLSLHAMTQHTQIHTHTKTDFSKTGIHVTVVSAPQFWICLLYFVLRVGHGAVKRPLLKLEVVRVQLLCEHATWRHGDLGDRRWHVCTLFCANMLVEHFTLLWKEINVSLFQMHC